MKLADFATVRELVAARDRLLALRTCLDSPRITAVRISPGRDRDERTKCTAAVFELNVPLRAALVDHIRGQVRELDVKLRALGVEPGTGNGQHTEVTNREGQAEQRECA